MCSVDTNYSEPCSGVEPGIHVFSFNKKNQTFIVLAVFRRHMYPVVGCNSST